MPIKHYVALNHVKRRRPRVRAALIATKQKELAMTAETPRLKAKPLTAEQLAASERRVATIVASIDTHQAELAAKAKTDSMASTAPTKPQQQAIALVGKQPRKRRLSSYQILKKTGIPYRHHHLIRSGRLKREDYKI